MSVKFTASGDTIGRADTSISGTSSRSVCMWVKKTTSSDNAFGEINFGALWGINLSTFSGDMFLGDFSNVTSSLYAFTFVVNQWYHIGYTYDGTDIKIYLDGVLVATNAWNSAGAPAGTAWQFGASNVELQDISLWSTNLFDYEIQALRVRRRPMPTSTFLLAYYPLLTAATAGQDFSGKARALTPAGTPTDGADVPSTVWDGGSTRMVYIASSAINITATGLTQTTGGVPAITLPMSASGLTRTTGAVPAVTLPLTASGLTRTTGAVPAVTLPLTAAGLTQTNAVASTASGLSAAGSTQTFATAQVSAILPISATGLTRTTGNVPGVTLPLTAVGTTRTTGGVNAITVTAAASGTTATFATAVLDGTPSGGGHQGAVGAAFRRQSMMAGRRRIR